MRPVSLGSDFLVRSQDLRGGRLRKLWHAVTPQMGLVLRELGAPSSPWMWSVTVLNVVSNPSGFCFGQEHVHSD